MPKRNQTDLAVTDGRTLEELAKQANYLHHQFEGALTHGLPYAVECGKVLAIAKAQVPHGEWEIWLRSNFDGSIRMAQRYMKAAIEYPLLGFKNDNGSFLPPEEGEIGLSQRKALEMLSDSQDQPAALERKIRKQAAEEGVTIPEPIPAEHLAMLKDIPKDDRVTAYVETVDVVSNAYNSPTMPSTEHVEEAIRRWTAPEEIPEFLEGPLKSTDQVAGIEQLREATSLLRKARQVFKASHGSDAVARLDLGAVETLLARAQKTIRDATPHEICGECEGTKADSEGVPCMGCWGLGWLLRTDSGKRAATPRQCQILEKHEGDHYRIPASFAEASRRIDAIAARQGWGSQRLSEEESQEGF